MNYWPCLEINRHERHQTLPPLFNRNIELIRYRLFGDDLLLLELANATSTGAGGVTTAKNGKASKPAKGNEKAGTGDKTYAEWLESISSPLRELVTI